MNCFHLRPSGLHWWAAKASPHTPEECGHLQQVSPRTHWSRLWHANCSTTLCSSTRGTGDCATPALQQPLYFIDQQWHMVGRFVTLAKPHRTLPRLAFLPWCSALIRTTSNLRLIYKFIVLYHAIQNRYIFYSSLHQTYPTLIQQSASGDRCLTCPNSVSDPTRPESGPQVLKQKWQRHLRRIVDDSDDSEIFGRPTVDLFHCKRIVVFQYVSMRFNMFIVNMKKPYI